MHRLAVLDYYGHTLLVLRPCAGVSGEKIQTIGYHVESNLLFTCLIHRKLSTVGKNRIMYIYIYIYGNS